MKSKSEIFKHAHYLVKVYREDTGHIEPYRKTFSMKLKEAYRIARQQSDKGSVLSKAMRDAKNETNRISRLWTNGEATAAQKRAARAAEQAAVDAYNRYMGIA